MDHYIKPLLEYRKLIAAITALVVLAGLALWFILPATYESTTSVLLKPISADPLDQLESDSNAEVDLPTELLIATSTAVLNMAAEELAAQSIGMSATEVASRVTASSPRNTKILEISFEASTPELAQIGANTIAKNYLTYRAGLAADNRSVAVDALNQRISLLKENLTQVEGELKQTVADSQQFVALNVERDSLFAELAAQQDALAALSTLSVDAGEVLDPAPLPTSTSGLDLMTILVGSIVGGLVLGSIMALIVGAAKASMAPRSRRATDRIDQNRRREDRLVVSGRRAADSIPGSEAETAVEKLARVTAGRDDGSFADQPTADLPAADQRAADQPAADQDIEARPETATETAVVVPSVSPDEIEPSVGQSTLASQTSQEVIVEVPVENDASPTELTVITSEAAPIPESDSGPPPPPPPPPKKKTSQPAEDVAAEPRDVAPEPVPEHSPSTETALADSEPPAPPAAPRATSLEHDDIPPPPPPPHKHQSSSNPVTSGSGNGQNHLSRENQNDSGTADREPVPPIKFRVEPSDLQAVGNFDGLALALASGSGPLALLAVGEQTRAEAVAAAFSFVDALDVSSVEILIIDAMLDDPTLTGVLQLEETPGLAEALAGQVSLISAIQSVPELDQVHAISAGRPSALAKSALSTDTFRQLLREAKRHYGLTIIVVGDVADAAMITRADETLDGVLISTQRPVGHQAAGDLIHKLGGLPAPVWARVSAGGTESAARGETTAAVM